MFYCLHFGLIVDDTPHLQLQVLICSAWMAAWRCVAPTPHCRIERWSASCGWRGGSTRHGVGVMAWSKELAFRLQKRWVRDLFATQYSYWFTSWRHKFVDWNAVQKTILNSSLGATLHAPQFCCHPEPRVLPFQCLGRRKTAPWWPAACDWCPRSPSPGCWDQLLILEASRPRWYRGVGDELQILNIFRL